ncbi:MAG: peptidoglycan-binding domain-containing protein [Candidatus Omnitrophota bacterium]
MSKRAWLLAAVAVFVFSLAGCSTARNKDLEIQGLRNQVSALKAQAPEESEQVTALEEITIVQSEEAEKKEEARECPTSKQIQAALKNAGYYSGPIDGKIGRKSRQAIRDFQKANNLSVDGKVGKKTWGALKEFLQKKVK